MPCQTTLRAPLSFEGHGIHSGKPCSLLLAPAPADYGVRFIRKDLDEDVAIPGSIEVVSEEPLLRQIVLCAPDHPDISVQTVEHILAVLHALRIDNVRVEMTGPEPPIWDGSAGELARQVSEGGTEDLPDSEKGALTVDRVVTFAPPDSPGVDYVAWPSNRLVVTYFLEYDHPFIGSQAVSFTVEPDLFVREIAPARTFCTYEEVEFLRSKGLIRGGDINNAIVIGRDCVLNTELLWEDELARHKVLDLIGDLFLLQKPVTGHIIARRAGHHTNAQFVQFLKKEFAQT